ncbi:MAG TPA: hypothetical protein VMY39_10590, partial [Planctomycetota bacterium]|nr:hypothetical protein [Planctomycetota bacterium]
TGAKPAISAYPEWEWWADAWLGRNRHRLGQVFLGPDWKFRRTDPNVLTLDRCRWRAGGGKLSEVTPLFRAQMDVRKKLGLRPNHDNGDVQRWRWVHGPKETKKAPTEYHFEFDVDVVPKGDVSLVIEGSELYRIRLNGKNVPSRKTGWYLDHSMHKVSLPRLKVGKNTLVLACDTTTTMQTEDCFIMGDFGVTPSREITTEPDILHAGDWAMQGYLHYAGGIVYEAEFDVTTKKPAAAVLKLGKFSAVVVAIRVNGELAGYIPWRSADGLDVAKFLKPGRNRVEIEVMGSPRNMLGPLHHAAGKPAWTGAGQFLVTGPEYTPDYIVWPWGLMDQVSITLFGK